MARFQWEVLSKVRRSRKATIKCWTFSSFFFFLLEIVGKIEIDFLGKKVCGWCHSLHWNDVSLIDWMSMSWNQKHAEMWRVRLNWMEKWLFYFKAEQCSPEKPKSWHSNSKFEQFWSNPNILTLKKKQNFVNFELGKPKFQQISTWKTKKFDITLEFLFEKSIFHQILTL